MVIAGHDFKPADTPVTRVMAAPVVVAAGMVVVALAPIVTLGRGRVPNRSASLDFGQDADQHAVRPGRDGPGLGRVAVVMGLGKDMPAQSTCIACSVNWGRPADSVDLSATCMRRISENHVVVSCFYSTTCVNATAIPVE